MSNSTMEAAPKTVAMSVQNTLRDLANKTRYTVGVNIEGLTHAESLTQPQPAGNCSNWVLGHLLTVYSKTLPMFGGKPVIGPDRLKHYERGSAPLLDAHDAIPFDELVAAWNTTCNMVDAGISQVSDEMLLQPVPESPTNNPNETVHSLLFTIMFHQAYHSGQLGVLRRVAGKDGAIK
ncbi:MAG: DinB family protein [Gemmatimonas sp.]